MHEFSIAVDLVDLACEEAQRLNAARVHTVHLRLGALSGVDREALLYSFEMAARGSAIEGARLHISETTVTAWCDGCERAQRLWDVRNRRCPVCGAPTPTLVSGDELTVVSMEIEDANQDRRGP